MKTPAQQKIKLRFPLHLYCQQLFTPGVYVKFINPFSFWHQYRINHLESCWEFNLIRYLENCRQIDCQGENFQNHYLSDKVTAINVYRGLLWEKTPKNTLLITQPTIKLKYRGVTYYTNQRSGIDIDRVKTQSEQIGSDSSDKVITNSKNNYLSQSDSTINF